MPPIKPMNMISAKWTSRARSSADDYRRGVETTTKDWASETAAATTRYNEGVQQAISANRYQNGVVKTGTPGWKAATLSKGPARWAEGVQKSGDKYAQGFQPYRAVIESTTLPPRGPRGSAQNYERSAVMGRTLHEAKVSAT